MNNKVRRLNNNTKAFFELVRAGLFPVNGSLLMVSDSLFKDVDWDEVYRLAEEQSVVGLVAAGIEELRTKNLELSVPQEWALQFIGATLQIEQRNKAMNGFVARLIELLRKNNIYAVLVKGQGIAQCYEKPLWRASGDVDLLLSDSNYEKAKALLVPLASEVETEYKSLKHLGMAIDGWVVELHGTLHSRLSAKVDRVIDEAQNDVFFAGNVRTWQNGGTQVFLPSSNNDVIFVFTHILHHFFIEGVGLRQICDWCRLLWTYHSEINGKLLEQRLREMGLMTEWKAFAAYAVNWLGMPTDAMPLYSPESRWKKKAERINRFVMKVGNFGHKNRRNYEGKPYIVRKFLSFWDRLSDMLRHIRIFPLDSIRFFGGVLRSGLHAAVRGE